MNRKKIFKLTALSLAVYTSSNLVNVGNIIARADDSIIQEVKDKINNDETTGDSVVLEKENKNELVKNNNIDENVVYSNDFEDGESPNQINWGPIDGKAEIAEIKDNNLLKISNFKSSEKTEIAFETDSEELLPAGSKVEFDVIVPKSQVKDGKIEYNAGLSQADKDWTWIGANGGKEGLTDFEELNSEYVKKTVSVSIGEECKGLKRVIVQIIGLDCEYTGPIYIDNIKVVKVEAGGESELPAVEPIKWTFDDSTEGWEYGGTWDYHGSEDGGKAEDVSHDNNIQALKLDLDYSSEGNAWSEFKINKNLGDKKNINGYNTLTYDFIYNPKNMTMGSFKTKLFIIDGPAKDIDIDLDGSKEIGNGLKKAKVTIQFTSMNVDINSITLSIVGNKTNYKGNIYIDNIELGQKAQDDIYVKKTATVIAQDSIDISDIEPPKKVKLVDEKATDETASLYSYLKGVGKTDYVLYGHQNDTHHKAVLKESSTNSDTKDVTGSIAAISGIDSLSLTGAELQLTSEEEAKGLDLITKAANLGIDASKEGGIITLSCHMPNFALVAEKGKVDGKYDYSGYTPNVTSGDVVSRIMPGGDLNEAYTGYLDLIADYGNKLEEAGVPVLFRPFHENNGSWFWWGKAFCDEEAYKNLFKYTVEYLRDSKDVHNFLYVYSPNGPFENEADYLSRYPGDEFIDVIAFDMYHDDPLVESSKDPWMKSLKETIELLQGIADKRGKLSAVSETGVRYNGGATIVSGNPNKNWFKDVSDIISKSDMPYYMVWANFDTDNFFAPYMVSDTKGHEMINEFIEYYNDNKSIFANGVGNYTDITTEVEEGYSYGFIISPISRNRILEPVTITARVKGYDKDIKFLIKNKEGQVIEIINAILENGIYSGKITQDILNKLGETVGSIDLCSEDKVLNSISALFNMKEAEQDSKLVDNFEDYFGDDGLLESKWITNAGPGCSVTNLLSQDKLKSGKYGLEFKYTISTEKTSEGYAGITKTLEVDWSSCDALRLWCQPDGYGQKLVIQITSNGEDFEVFLPEFAATKEAQVLTIPFSNFKGKNGGELDLSKIEKMGIWCNTIVPDGYEGEWTVDSSMYFDDIKAINTKDQSNDNNNNNSSSSSSSSSGSHKRQNKDKDTTVEENDNKEDNKIGWQKNENAEWYYVQADGTKKIGWLQDTNGKWYYLKINGIMKTGWLQDIDGRWYYLEADGAMKTGWFKDVDGRWYYLQGNGAMKMGWLKDIDGRWYYLQSNGAMKTGWFKDVNGRWYYLKENGQMAINEVINGYKINNNGEWAN